MDPITTVLILMLAVTIFGLIASKLNVPYPTMMVLGGLLICFLPRLRSLQLAPAVIFNLFLPPLLYGAAWQISWKDFRTFVRPIFLLSVGLVLFTTAGCALFAMHFIPGFTWPAAFALGAILSPPDAIAVTALTKKVRLPRRVIFILEGESLVNDASALVALKFAIAATVTGTFFFSAALSQFLFVSIGGIALGLLVAWLVALVHSRLNDSLIETTITFLTPYTAYILGDQLQVSGVLAVVTAGLFLSWRIPAITSPQTRLQMKGVWEFILFLLNGFVFVLVGLDLPSVVRQLPDFTLLQLIRYGLIITAGVILLRILWVIPGAYVPRLLSKRIRTREPHPPFNQVLLIGWTGMRGVVSLAAALALPRLLADGTPFPNRGVIIFLAFFIILTTLVCQSLTLPFVIRLLRIKFTEDHHAEEREARLLLATTALNHLETIPLTNPDLAAAAEELRHTYQQRIAHLTTTPNLFPLPSLGLRCASPEDLHRTVLQAERQAVLNLRASQKISYELYEHLMTDLDTVESHLHD